MSAQSVYRATVTVGDDELTVSTTDADAAAAMSEAGLRVTAKTGCGL